MGFLPATGFGAGAGGQMLQQIQDAQQRAAEIAQQQELARQHLLLDQQEAQQRGQIQQATLQSLVQDRQAKQQGEAEASAEKLTPFISPQTTLDPNDPAVKVLQGGNLGFLLHPDQTLGSTNIQGAAGGPLSATANPGQATGQLRYIGTPQQQQAITQRGQLQDFLNNPQLSPEARLAIQYESLTGKNAPAGLIKPNASPETEGVYNIGPGGTMTQVGTVPKGSHISNTPTAPQDRYVLQTVPDPDHPGKTVILRVDTTTNTATPVTGPGGAPLGGKSGVNATLDTRLQSAQAVTQTGNDIIKMLSDPKIAAELGPVLGRASSAADFFGSPPKGWGKLAGMIESYSLANMGVHGMRSANGAEAIKQTIGQGRHDPQTLIDTIQGLNGFASHLLENNGRGATNKAVYYDKDGNPIKQ